ncbi:MAG: dihydrolipoyl dehydrogenase [Dehalococcoidia bacterium]|nr:dihydrolipoyl dehydrogenase [Dehalococcoidia bacterium]MDW8120096.1 dihydrolipoyl dehydrogenase [Chloroflexota bacterium]
MADYDLVVIGGGPGGYVAAIRAGQLGLKTALVERDQVGGVCLNWGCIPSKALLRNAELVHWARHANDWGIAFDNLRLDFGKAIDRSRQVVQRLVRGVEFLLRKNKVETIRDEAVLRGNGQVALKVSGRTVRARALIVATGARPRSLPVLPVDGQVVLTSREALERKDLPASCIIVGGGATGCEFAYLYTAYGVQVTIVELLPHLLPNEDEEVSQALERSFQKQGMRILTGAKVTSLQKNGSQATLTVETAQGPQTLTAQRVLVCVGIQPNSEGIGLEEAGVRTERGGWIAVDDRQRTSAPTVYAIGDVTGRMPLAHVASAQAVLAVETLAGKETRPLDYTLMPRAVYCHPQVASWGLTEKQAQEAGHTVKVGKFPFTASGKALAMGDTEGFVKVVADAQYGEILGVHMIGPEVTELLPELALARLLEGTVRETGWLVHAHPTLSEALKEASLAVLGEAIHI